MNSLFTLTCWLICMPLVIISVLPRSYVHIARAIGFISSMGLLLVWSNVLLTFNFSEMLYQQQYHLIGLIPSQIAEFTFGVDGFSLCLMMLTTVIMPICIYSSINITHKVHEFLICLLLIEFFLMLSFYTTNLLFFYLFFESMLIPMFIMIGYWGSRDSKIKAAYYFFFYTLFGSLFMLFGILYLSTLVGSLNYDILLNQEFSQQTHLFLFILFFIPFAMKIPMFPFHIWLPEAHVEAPTMGSMILASLLLKLGSFGFLSFTIPLFWYGVSYFSVLIDILAVLSVVYASLATMRQIDMKSIIAYSSIAHMNLIVLGLFSVNQHGIDGAIYLMIGHGIVSSALFFCVGVLYDRYHTRLLKYYSGLAMVMPLFAMFFFLFTLANMSFPGTSNFIGEFVMLTGIFNRNSFITLCAGTGIVLSAIYSIWLFNRVCFGTLKMKYMTKFSDLTSTEFLVLTTLSILMLFLGVNSQFIFDLAWYNI